MAHLRPKVLVTEPIPEKCLTYLNEHADLHIGKIGEFQREDNLVRTISDYDALLCMLSTPVTKEVLESAQNLKIVANFAVGYNNIDVEAAKSLGIKVANTPDVLTAATAEIAMLVLLGAARRAKEGIEWARKKNWKWTADFLMGKELTKARLGILGMGRIGRAIAARARSFGMKIHYYNRVRLSPDLEKDSVYHDSIKSLFSVSDFLSINCTATEETKYIINKKTLNYFPNGAVIANSARGEMIEDVSMIEALKSGKIYSLGLDVYNGEPNIHPEYINLSNVFVLPH